MGTRAECQSLQTTMQSPPYLEFLGVTWRFMGSYKWGYKSPNMGYKYGCLTYNHTYNYP